MENYLCISFVIFFSSLFLVSSSKSIYSPEEPSLVYEDVPNEYYTNSWAEKRAAAPVMPYRTAAFRPWANIRNSKRISEQEIRSVLKNAWLG